MNDAERRELEEMLRDALHQEAARIQPAGDGLARIRQRVATRRRILSWLRPGLGVVAAVCTAVAATTVVPLYLRGDARHQDTAGQSLSAPPGVSSTVQRDALTAASSPVPSALRSPDVSTRSEATAPDGGKATLPDMVTVWPYGTRGEGGSRADQDVRQHPDLADPLRVAKQFVQSFVGSDNDLVTQNNGPLEAGIGVTVFRKADDGSRQPVSLVYLVRVQDSDSSPYVVVDARGVDAKGRPAMTLDPGPLQGTAKVPVEGTFVDLPGGTAAVQVELREPGSEEILAHDMPRFVSDAGVPPQQVWKTSLTPVRALHTRTGTVAAWTVDVDNHVLAFVAEPTDG
jgi:hypothetical protein